jgi:Translation initiation factor IF-2, N-terminal region
MAKLRIYELARELGVDSKQVMVALQANGEFVRSAASAIEPDAAQAVRERLRRQPGGEERRPGRRPYREFVPGATGLARVIPREARPPVRPGRTVAIRDLAPLERLIAVSRAEAARIPEHAVESIRAQARAWAAQWFTDKDAEPWLALRVQPVDAGQCRQLGITPELIQLPFQMRGRARGGGTLTYLTAFFRGIVTIPEIRDDLARSGHLPGARLPGVNQAGSL